MKFTNELTIKEAITPEQRAEAFRIRYQVYKDANYIDDSSAGVHNDQFTDAYEDHSTIFLLMKNDLAVGTIRITPTSKGELPIEHYLNLKDDLEKYKNSCEFSRFALLKQHRGNLLSILLAFAALEFCEKNNIRYIYTETKKGGLTDFYEKAGAKIIIEGKFDHPFAKESAFVILERDLGEKGSLKRWFSLTIPRIFVKLWVKYPKVAYFVFQTNIYSKKFIGFVLGIIILLILTVGYLFSN